MDEAYVPNTEGMPPEYLNADGDAELQDPGLMLETSTADLRELWEEWLCHRGSGKFVDQTFFGRSIGGVATPAADAFKALEMALRSTGYSPASAWAYNCRNIAGTDRYSLHSFGIAIDIDPAQNPFSTGDPYSGKIQLDHVEAVLDIKNVRGRSIWAWGGNWTKRDRMHFQIDQAPNAVDVDWSTVPGGSAQASSPSAKAAAGSTSITIQEERVLTRGAKGTAVERFQNALKAWNNDALPEYGVDGGYGTETIEWVKKYQEAMGLPVSGNIDGLTAAMLVTEGAAKMAGRS